VTGPVKSYNYGSLSDWCDRLRGYSYRYSPPVFLVLNKKEMFKGFIGNRRRKLVAAKAWIKQCNEALSKEYPNFEEDMQKAVSDLIVGTMVVNTETFGRNEYEN